MRAHLARWRSRSGSSLAWRVLLLNSAVVAAACVLLAVSPASVSAPVEVGELTVLVAGLALTLIANVLLVRRAFAPLDRLAAVMRIIDPLAPGTRVPAEPATRDVRALATAFNEMLERLEDERRESARRAVQAQERERRRLARELHDELGQSLTGVLLLIDEASRSVAAPELETAREAARTSLDEVRRIARDLRPDTLEELGLVSALNALATRFTRQTRVRVERRLPPLTPALSEETEVVLYRVAQEALTNVARHAAARHVLLELRHDPRGVTLVIDDDGSGLPSDSGAEGRGLTGMRERALLVHGRLTLGRSPAGGAHVRLDVPAVR